MDNFLGKDGFFWWMGVVEDNADPLGLGRVRIRIFGYHTDNIQELPTNTLPWSLPCFSPNNTMSIASPLVGDYAFGFFGDGMSHQFPVVLGIMPGIPKSGSTSGGFSSGTHYPVGEPTTSRLHRNYKTDQTVIGYHNSILDENVPTATGNTWSEPASTYNAKIPYDRVTETVSGHVFEMDDTPGAERIQLAHRANTFFEIAADGSKVTKVSGKNYEIYLDDNNVHIKGMCNITIDGNASLYIKGDSVQQIDGNANLYVKGNTTQKNDGTFTGTASSFTFNGDTTINGHLQVNGGINSTGDVVGGGISLDSHRHGGVRAGGDVSGPPQ